MARSPEVLALLEALPDATALLAPGGRVACANALFRALFGNALEGRTLLELTRDADAGLAVAEALAGATRKLELTLPVARRSLQVFLSPFGDGALLTARDITEAKRMERARRDFVANASHELRTPVTAIFGAAETLLGGAVNEPAAALGFVEMIARHADRLSRLTQELLDLSRIESGEWEVQTTPLAVFGLATSTLELFRPRADQKKLTLRCTVEANLQVFADRRALEQVLVNLLDNAVKYTPAGGAVTLSGARQAGWVTLTVSDTGPGIDRHHLGRLFERFYRVDPGRARDAGGTGLGLAIVKHLAQAMGGEVGVESNREGSRFWIRLAAS
jgi:two-component system phosphate regulon sensor histidine kinase PhoR